MKTAQEWAEERFGIPKCECNACKAIPHHSVEAIKAIQFDAYHAGMLAAADLCLSHNDSGEGFKCHVAIGVVARDAVLPTVAPKV